MMFVDVSLIFGDFTHIFTHSPSKFFVSASPNVAEDPTGLSSAATVAGSWMASDHSPFVANTPLPMCAAGRLQMIGPGERLDRLADV